MLVSIFTTRMVRSAVELFAIEKMPSQGTSIKKIAETLGVPLENDKVVLTTYTQKRDDLGDQVMWKPLKDTSFDIFQTTPAFQNGPPLILSVHRGPLELHQNPKMGPWAKFFLNKFVKNKSFKTTLHC